MSLREKLESQKSLLSLASIGIIVIALSVVILEGRDKNAPLAPPHSAFFTIDDGKSWFVDSADRIAPFDYNGKTAVRAYVFLDSSGNKFVGYLEKFTPEAQAEQKQLLDKGANSGPGPNPPPFSAPTLYSFTGRLVKKPGDQTWVSVSNTTLASSICSVQSSGAAAKPVEP